MKFFWGLSDNACEALAIWTAHLLIVAGALSFSIIYLYLSLGPDHVQVKFRRLCCVAAELSSPLEFKFHGSRDEAHFCQCTMNISWIKHKLDYCTSILKCPLFSPYFTLSKSQSAYNELWGSTGFDTKRSWIEWKKTNIFKMLLSMFSKGKNQVTGQS